MEGEPLAEILPITHPNGVERINGVKMHLGAMNIEQLFQLETYARERIAEAQHDLLAIQYYEEQLLPDGDVA